MKLINYIVIFLLVLSNLCFAQVDKNSVRNVIVSISQDTTEFQVYRKKRKIPDYLYDHIETEYNFELKLKNSCNQKTLFDYNFMFNKKRRLIFYAYNDNFMIINYVKDSGRSLELPILIFEISDKKVIKSHLVFATKFEYNFTDMIENLIENKYAVRPVSSVYL